MAIPITFTSVQDICPTFKSTVYYTMRDMSNNPENNVLGTLDATSRNTIDDSLIFNQNIQNKKSENQSQQPRFGYQVLPPMAANSTNVLNQGFPLYEMRRYQFAIPRRTVPPDDFRDILVMQQRYETQQ